jgi:hypothetical protein
VLPSPSDAGAGLRQRPATAEGLQFEAWHAAENSIVGDKRQAKPDRGCGDPAICVVRLMGQGMPRRSAVGAQLGVDEDELRSAVHHLNVGELALELDQPGSAPAPQQRSEADFSRL